MTAIPAGIAAEAAQVKQNVALSNIKKNAEAAQQIADLVAESADAIAASSTRGTKVNIVV